MTTRFIKKTVILVKTETTQGVDASPTGAANAIQALDVSISPVELKSTNLEFLSAWFGAAVTLPGATFTKLSFTVALAGSGTAATAPAWGALLLACANAETTGLLTPNRVEYLTATDSLKSATIYWHDDGLLHPALGCMGNMAMSVKAGEVGKIKFDIYGCSVTPTAVANATPVLTPWKPPVPITKANVTDVSLGCTYATGTLSGGTSYNSTGFTLDWGNKVDFVPMLSTEEVVMDGRKLKGAMSLELSAAQEITEIAATKAGTTQSFGFVLGTTTGNKLMVHAPAMRWTGYKKGSVSGKRVIDLDFELDPVSGNDEVRLIHL
jgi:hypothetical protein